MAISSEPGRCQTCRYYDPSRERCRFDAPRVIAVDGELVSVWPAVAVDDWCGEWGALRTRDQRVAG